MRSVAAAAAATLLSRSRTHKCEVGQIGPQQGCLSEALTKPYRLGKHNADAVSRLTHHCYRQLLPVCRSWRSSWRSSVS